VARSHVLVYATDAGGARDLAAVVGGASGETDFSVFAGVGTAGIFAEHGIDYDIPDAPDRLFDQLRPDVYLCGRTRYPGAERRLISTARCLGIPSTLVLDEWFNYRLSILDEDGRAAFIPDRICCPDDQAFAEAVADRLPEDRLVVTGSPALSMLADQCVAFAQTPPPVPSLLAEDCLHPVITFLSETHGDDYGCGPEERGPLGPYLGYSEHSVRGELMDVLSALGQSCTVIEKLHPSATEKEQPPPGNPNVHWQVTGHQALWPLMWHSDLVVGMRSMALLQAAVMSKTAISYQPNLRGPDQCTASRLGLVDKGRHIGDLEVWLRSHCVEALDSACRPPLRPAFAHPDAAKRVLAVALGQAAP
jgi:hypothetical protein